MILAGSIPSSLPSDIYQRIMDKLRNKDVKIVVDATKDYRYAFHMAVAAGSASAYSEELATKKEVSTIVCM